MYATAWLFIQLKKHLQQNSISFDIGAISPADIRKMSNRQLLETVANNCNISGQSISPILTLVAMAFGGLVMVGLLSMNSANQPINLLYLLLVFGPIQWLFMVIALVALFNNRIPFVNQSLIQVKRNQLLMGLPSRLAGSAFFYLNQTLSVWFLVSAILVYLVALGIQDISFGWQTTFNWHDDLLNQVLSFSAFPWAGIWPEAQPNAELISQTRFYRLADADLTDSNVAIYGQWWRFILAFMLFYALLPRLLLKLFAAVRFNNRLNEWIETDPVFQQQINQIRSGSLIIESSAGKSTDLNEQANIDANTTLLDQLIHAEDINFSWKLADKHIPATLISSIQSLGQAGSWEQDQQRLSNQNNRATDNERHWNVLVAGWEPPTAELSDLLEPFQHQQNIRIIPLPLKVHLEKNHWLSWVRFHKTHLSETRLVTLKPDKTGDSN